MKNKLKDPAGQFMAKMSNREQEREQKDCIIDLTQRSMAKSKEKVSKQQNSFKVTAREVPQEELLKLFRELENNIYNNEIPF